jgi:hypothetical protein
MVLIVISRSTGGLAAILPSLGTQEPWPFFWTAPAKRSGDGAFRTRQARKHSGTFLESGVALRLPPQSKTCRSLHVHWQEETDPIQPGTWLFPRAIS